MRRAVTGGLEVRVPRGVAEPHGVRCVLDLGRSPDPRCVLPAPCRVAEGRFVLEGLATGHYRVTASSLSGARYPPVSAVLVERAAV